MQCMFMCKFGIRNLYNYVIKIAFSIQNSGFNSVFTCLIERKDFWKYDSHTCVSSVQSSIHCHLQSLNGDEHVLLRCSLAIQVLYITSAVSSSILENWPVRLRRPWVASLIKLLQQ